MNILRARKCPICRVWDVSTDCKEGISINCQLCGKFIAHQSVQKLLMSASLKVERHLISGLTRNVSKDNTEIEVLTTSMLQSDDSFRKKARIPIPNKKDILAKADYILRYLDQKSARLGDPVTLLDGRHYSVGFCIDDTEFKFCLAYLVQRLFVSPHKTDEKAFIITPAGWSYLAGVGVEVKEQGFIAMAFRPKFSSVLYETGLLVGIYRAGYKPLRIDRKEHNNRIDDEIVAEIRKSKFIVADLTGKNAGAYFEAGFARGLGKPVVWTCEQGTIEKKNGVHFDVRQHSIVPWEPGKYADFAARLTQRIEATIGHGLHI